MLSPSEDPFFAQAACKDRNRFSGPTKCRIAFKKGNGLQEPGWIEACF